MLYLITVYSHILVLYILAVFSIVILYYIEILDLFHILWPFTVPVVD